MTIEEQLIEQAEKIRSLENLYQHVNERVADGFNLYWMILIGIFTVLSVALFFIVKSAIQNGVDKGLREKGKDVDAQNEKISQIQKMLELHWLNAPFTRGTVGHGQYCKVGNITLLKIEFSFSSDDSSAVMTFPEGYRPVNDVSAVAFSKGFPSVTIGLIIGSDGFVFCRTPVAKNVTYTLETFFSIEN